MQEIKLSLNTGKGQSTIRTEPIKGELHSLIINSLEKVSIIIESELGYIIYNEPEIVGTEHILPRGRTRAPNPSLMDIQSFEKFLLNEVLIVTIIGRKNHDVEIILRIE